MLILGSRLLAEWNMVDSCEQSSLPKYRSKLSLDRESDTPLRTATYKHLQIRQLGS